jgi:hypothetical protein
VNATAFEVAGRGAGANETFMTQERLLSWFGTVSIILVLAGIVFAFFGLRILPVDRTVLLQWQSALYGSIMMGWGVTLFFIGRVAFRRNDPDLKRSLIYGLIVWLATEAAFSLYFRVWFNVGVDIAVFGLFLIPLAKGLKS